MDGIRGIRIGRELPGAEPVSGATGATGGAGSFANALGEALGQVSQLQQAADGETTRLAQGAGNLHETALALEKADVAMRLAMKVRNKLVDAYQEVMRMSV
jgi:flagellar hook-basal body complex protein FliE